MPPRERGHHAGRSPWGPGRHAEYRATVRLPVGNTRIAGRRIGPHAAGLEEEPRRVPVDLDRVGGQLSPSRRVLAGPRDIPLRDYLVEFKIRSSG